MPVSAGGLAKSAVPPVEWSSAIAALADYLRGHGYRFTAVTPETHRRVVANHAPCSDPLRDAFGWNRSFASDVLDESVFSPLLDAGAVTPVEGSNVLFRSGVRFATLGDHLFAHSSFPTEASDSVFFGPDTYRFAALIARVLQRRQQRCERVIDIGCGSGAGGIVCASMLNGQPDVVLADINPRALLFSAANARVAGLDRVRCVQSDVLASVPGEADREQSSLPRGFARALVSAWRQIIRRGIIGANLERGASAFAPRWPAHSLYRHGVGGWRRYISAERIGASSVRRV
jgi:methylase of polypeptide subunit release factors